MHNWINLPPFPPLLFVANRVQRPVVCGTQWYDPLVADLPPQGPGLGKAQMVRMPRRAPAYEAGLFADKPQVTLVPHPPRGADR